MKKVLFCLSLIISLSVLGAVPSFAMEFTLDPATIGSLGDLGYGLAGGVDFDFNDSFIAAKYKGEYTAAGNSQGKRLVAVKAANDFITNYAISRGLPLPSDASDYVDNLPTDTYSYFKSVYFDNQTRSITNKAKLAGNDAALLSDALRFGIGPSAFADWAEYNQFWYSKYLNQVGEGDIPEDPDIPETLQPLVDNIGSYSLGSFNFKPNQMFNNGWGNSNKIYKTGDFSIWSQNGQFSNKTAAFTLTGNFKIFGYGTIALITHPDQTVTATLTGFYNTYFDNTNLNMASNGIVGDFYYGDGCIQFRSLTNNTSNLNVTEEFAGLNTAINWVNTHFRHVNLTVNGISWTGEIDQAPANPIIPEFPDIIDRESDDPAYYIDLPQTDTGEGYFDITSLFDALVDAIEGALDDDLATDGVLTGDNALAYEDEAGAAVGDDPIADDDVIDDSIPDPTGLPNIPVPLPPIQDAFSGTTVLAELVHATDVVMPDDLMAVFWGIVFILFIIGLIKVLHK